MEAWFQSIQLIYSYPSNTVTSTGDKPYWQRLKRKANLFLAFPPTFTFYQHKQCVNIILKCSQGFLKSHIQMVTSQNMQCFLSLLNKLLCSGFNDNILDCFPHGSYCSPQSSCCHPCLFPHSSRSDLSKNVYHILKVFYLKCLNG